MTSALHIPSTWQSCMPCASVRKGYAVVRTMDHAKRDEEGSGSLKS